MQEELNQLNQRVSELERIQADKARQQITFPLDPSSYDILNRYFMSIFSTVEFTGGVAGNTFTSFVGKQDNAIFEVTAPTSVQYTASASTDFLTVVTTYLKFFDDTAVEVYTETGGAVPGGLAAATTYYVRDSSDGRTFKLSATLGGAAINLTDAGTGLQFINYSA